MARKRAPSSLSITTINTPLTFDKIKGEDNLREVFIESLGGKVFIRPISSKSLYDISHVRTEDTGTAEACHIISQYLASNVCKDNLGSPLASYDQWMSLTPEQILNFFNILSESLGSGGDEKNE